MLNPNLLTLHEDESSDYGPRTRFNATNSQATLAFALDYTTHGEKLTARCAKDKYISAPLRLSPSQAAEKLLPFLIDNDFSYLNIAGNGLYTLNKFSWNQDMVNSWVYQTLFIVNQKHKIYKIRSGGQTGVDTAALVASIALDIPAIGLYPKGYKLRKANGYDIFVNKDKLFNRIIKLANDLKTNHSQFTFNNFEIKNFTKI